jgi:nickel-dependent lactate racemase
MSKTLNVPFESAETLGATLPLVVPDSCRLLEFVPQEPEALADPGKALLEAVENPVGGEKLSQLVEGGKNVLLMIENQFRAAPTDILLLPLVKFLQAAGCSVKILIGSGKVGPLSDAEIKVKLGDELYGYGLPVCSNDVSQTDNYVFKGISTRGIPIWVHKWVDEAEVKITLGTTQATLWGYGGSGMVIPGTTNNETIEMNHIMSLSPTCIPGNNEAAMQLDKYEALKMCGITMGINVIVSNRFDVIGINAGEPEESHRASVAEYDKIYKFQVPEKADIVICGSTAPTDHLFFHTGWAVVNVDPVTKDDGTILFASPCPGYGAWPGFALMDVLKAYMPPSQAHNEAALQDFYSHKNELWAGCIWYKIYEVMVRKTCAYVTLEENLAFAKEVGLTASGPEDLQKEFDRLLAQYGPEATVAFVPYGRYTVLK